MRSSLPIWTSAAIKVKVDLLRCFCTQQPAWTKLIDYYDVQKYLAVNSAGKVNKITNAGHQKIVSDLDKGEWQNGDKTALVAYYCKDTSTEVFKKVLEAPLAGEATVIQIEGFFEVESDALRDVVAHAFATLAEARRAAEFPSPADRNWCC